MSLVVRRTGSAILAAAVGRTPAVRPGGYVEIRDRIKDITSGGKISHQLRWKGMLLQHPAVQKVAVAGIAHEH